MIKFIDSDFLNQQYSEDLNLSPYFEENQLSETITFTNDYDSSNEQRLGLSPCILMNEDIITKHTRVPAHIDKKISYIKSEANINRLLAEAITFLAYEEIQGRQTAQIKIIDNHDQFCLTKHLGTDGNNIPFPYFSVWNECLDQVVRSLLKLGYKIADSFEQENPNWIATKIASEYFDNIHSRIQQNRGEYTSVNLEQTDSGFQWVCSSIILSTSLPQNS